MSPEVNLTTPWESVITSHTVSVENEEPRYLDVRNDLPLIDQPRCSLSHQTAGALDIPSDVAVYTVPYTLSTHRSPLTLTLIDVVTGFRRL